MKPGAQAHGCNRGPGASSLWCKPLPRSDQWRWWSRIWLSAGLPPATSLSLFLNGLAAVILWMLPRRR